MQISRYIPATFCAHVHTSRSRYNVKTLKESRDSRAGPVTRPMLERKSLMLKKLSHLSSYLRVQLPTVVSKQCCRISVMSGTEPGHTASDSDSDPALPRPKKQRTSSFDFRKYVGNFRQLHCNIQQISPLCRFAKRHVVLRIAYLGWNYHGFAIQKTTPNTIEVYSCTGLHLKNYS